MLTCPFGSYILLTQSCWTLMAYLFCGIAKWCLWLIFCMLNPWPGCSCSSEKLWFLFVRHGILETISQVSFLKVYYIVQAEKPICELDPTP